MTNFDAGMMTIIVAIGLVLFGAFIRLILTAKTFQQALGRGASVGFVVGVLNGMAGASAAFALGKVLAILLWTSIIYGLKRLVLKFRKAPVIQAEKLT